MEWMKKACQRQDFKPAGDDFNHQKVRLYETPWILDVHDPVKNPEHVLAYLATIRQLMRFRQIPKRMVRPSNPLAYVAA